MKKSNNINYVDLARFIAILCVLFLHIFGYCFGAFSRAFMGIDKQISQSLIDLAHFGVPFFFMISGTLLLNPKKEISTKKWAKNYLLRIALAIIIFGSITEFLNILATNNWQIVAILNINTVKQIVLACATCSYSVVGQHFWFLYCIFVIYLTLPLLRIFTKKANLAAYIIVFIILLGVCPLLKTFVEQAIDKNLPYLHLYYFFYLFGYFLYKYNKGEIKRIVFYICIVVVIVSTVFIVYGSFNSMTWLTTESSFCSVLLALSLYTLITYYKGKSAIAQKCKPYIFGIYLVHPFFYTYGFFGLQHLQLHPFVAFPIVFIGDLLLSLATVYLLKKIKPLSKYIL